MHAAVPGSPQIGFYHMNNGEVKEKFKPHVCRLLGAGYAPGPWSSSETTGR